MKRIATELDDVIVKYYPILLAVDDNDLSLKTSPEKWSKKEIIGHLIDSAHSNLRRFVVGQYEDEPLITYKQEAWVKLNNYQEYSSRDLIHLWYLMNKQIVHLLKNISKEDRERKCKTPEPKTIKWLAEDYIKHLIHHIHVVLDFEQIAYP